MILCPRNERDVRYTTFLLATGHQGAHNTISLRFDAARRTVSQQVYEFRSEWIRLFGFLQTGDTRTLHTADTDWYETWIDYSHWYESERLRQIMREGLPHD